MSLNMKYKPRIRDGEFRPDRVCMSEFQMSQGSNVNLIGVVRHSAILGPLPNKHSKAIILTDLSYKIKSGCILGCSPACIMTFLTL